MKRKECVSLVVGPGPVTPWQGAWPRWHAARLCALLRRFGHRVLALDDDPSTIMDLGGARDEMYLEPPLPEVVEAVVERRGVECVWYGAGGRRAGALAARLSAEGAHSRLGFSTPDWDDRAWWVCGERSLLRETLEAEGFANPRCFAVRDPGEAQMACGSIGFPLVARAHFSVGGLGAGLAYNREDYQGLLEEATRESLTGELLVEEALVGWTKYVAVVLRDAWGGARVAGVLEQLSPLTTHEGDAVLITPPCAAGDEALYALREMALRVAETVSVTGACEVKLAASPGWEEIYVVDVNPVARDALVLLETLLGRDILRTHLRLVLGEDMESAAGDEESWRTTAYQVAVPDRPRWRGSVGEGHLSMARRSLSGRVFVHASPARAATDALAFLEGRVRSGGEETFLDPRARERLVAVAGKERRARSRHGGRRPMVDPLCVARPADGGMEGGLLFLDGYGTGQADGRERQAACMRALHAARKKGCGAALYTPDPGLAMLAAEEADAVFLGGLEAAAVSQAAGALGLGRVIAHFGGGEAMRCARALTGMGIAVEGLDELEQAARPAEVLEGLRASGLPMAPFLLTADGVGGPPDGLAFPLHVTPATADGRARARLAFTAAEALDVAAGTEGGLLWRPLNEDAREIQVEAVAWPGGGVTALLWEQLDAAGVSPGDGVAVYPPASLTTEQRKQALELARRAVEALGWRGNLSLRLMHDGESTAVWDAEPGASENLAFLEMASGVPLARMGLSALLGEGEDADGEAAARVSVRVPLPQRGVLTEGDILPSAARRSTGAAMGTARDYGEALEKALLSLEIRPQAGGAALLSVADRDKRRAVLLAQELMRAGYRILATRGTAHTLAVAGIPVKTVCKLREGRPNVLDLIRNGDIGLVVNVPRGRHPHCDGFYIREASIRHGIPCVTDMEVAMALVVGLKGAATRVAEPRALSEYEAAATSSRGG